MEELTALKQKILDLMRYYKGYETRVKRADMLRSVNVAMRHGVTDRTMRRAIEELRYNNSEGAYICSSTDGGYYRARNATELNAYLDQDEKRAKMILARTSRQRQRAIGAMSQSELTMAGLR